MTRNTGSTESLLSKHISTMTIALTKDLSAYSNVVIVKPNNTDALYAKYKKTSTGGTASVLTDLGFNDLAGNIWQIVISTELTPMHFGALGDNSTNDGVAINKAFKAGVDIHLPPERTFVYAGSLDVVSSNVGIRGRGKLKCTSVTGLNATGDLLKISGTDVLLDNIIIEDGVNSSSVNRTINIANARFKIRDSVLVSTYKRGIETTTTSADDAVLENVEHRTSRSTCTHNVYLLSGVTGTDIIGGKYDAAIYSADLSLSSSIINIDMTLGTNASTYCIGGSFAEVSGSNITVSTSTPVFDSGLSGKVNDNIISCEDLGDLSITLSFNDNSVTGNSGSILSMNIQNNGFDMVTDNSAGWEFGASLIQGNTFFATTTGNLVTNTSAGTPLFIGNVATGTITNFLHSTAGTPILVNNYKNGSLET